MKKITQFLNNKEKLFFFFIILLYLGRQLYIRVITTSREVSVVMLENNYSVDSLFSFMGEIKIIKVNVTRLASNNNMVLGMILLFNEEKNNTTILS